MNLRILAPISLALLACTATTSALAQQKVDPARSEISFVSKQMGVPVEGRFRKFDAQIAFDPKKPEAGKVAFTIDLGSTTLGNPETDAELPKAAWFNVPKFPQASFQSTSIKGLGSGRFEVAGKLSIKGRTKDVVLPFSFKPEGKGGVFEGSLAIRRSDFAVGEGAWADYGTVANEIQINFHLVATGK